MWILAMRTWTRVPGATQTWTSRPGSPGKMASQRTWTMMMATAMRMARAAGRWRCVYRLLDALYTALSHCFLQNLAGVGCILHQEPWAGRSKGKERHDKAYTQQETSGRKQRQKLLVAYLLMQGQWSNTQA